MELYMCALVTLFALQKKKNSIDCPSAILRKAIQLIELNSPGKFSNWGRVPFSIFS